MNVRFLVEGHLEQIFLNNVCNGIPASKGIPNGKTVSVSAIAKHVATQIGVVTTNAIYVVIFDREQRSETPKRIREALLESLRNEHGMDTNDIYVFVVDKMIENWIIAAWDEHVTDADSVQSPKIFLRKSMDGYDSLTDGPKLLKKGVPSRMAKRSASFRYLYDNIPSPVKDCWWLKKTDNAN